MYLAVAGTIVGLAQPASLPPTLPPYVPPPAKQTASEEREDEDARPDLSGARIGGELFVGSALLVAGAFVAGSIGYNAAKDCDYEGCGDRALLHGGLPAGAVGLVLGSTVGVYAIGSLGDEHGSFWATLGGSAGGALVASLVVLADTKGGNGQVHGVSVLALITAPVIGAAIGFNRTRQYDAHRWAPIASVTDGTTSFGVAGRF